MKFLDALVILSVAVMAVLVFQAAHQELQLRNMKTVIAMNSVEVKRKEQFIDEVKFRIQELKKDLTSVNTKIVALKKKRADTEVLSTDLNKSLQTCNTEKADAEKKKIEAAEALSKLKGDHIRAKTKAEVEIKNLKQQILDKDKALCAFADTTKEEARKLCGIAEAPK